MPNLALGEVHIWTARLPSSQDADLEHTLSEVERDCAHRFHFTKHRLAYVFAHAVLRDVLSRYLNRPAAALRFDKDSFGKPFLSHNTPVASLEFNLSHAGALVLIALSARRRIGVDVEEIRPMDDFTAIAEAHFTPRERAFIFNHAPAYRERAFFRCWTRKEAYIKAVGKGLSIRLNSFDTFIDAGQRGRQLAAGPDAPDVASWWLTDLDVPQDYLGALVVETGIDRLIYFEWKSRAIA
jgi:4'-phosphopantetheinyl transferase